MDEPRLRENELLLETIQPQFRIFLLRTLVITLLTVVFLGGVGIGADTWMWIAMLPVSVLYFIIMFDDYQEWMRHKSETWTLTSQRLFYVHSIEEPDPVGLPLGQIKRVRSWMFWAVRVQLLDGRKITLNYVADRLGLRDRIQKACANA